MLLFIVHDVLKQITKYVLFLTSPPKLGPSTCPLKTKKWLVDGVRLRSPHPVIPNLLALVSKSRHVANGKLIRNNRIVRWQRRSSRICKTERRHKGTTKAASTPVALQQPSRYEPTDVSPSGSAWLACIASKNVPELKQQSEIRTSQRSDAQLSSSNVLRFYRPNCEHVRICRD